jgi:heme-degrading monooxygenase HmoA
VWFTEMTWKLWKRGPLVADPVGDGFVSVTDFVAHRWRDLPRIYLAAMLLRRGWPSMEGAVGLWVWTKPLQKRQGSVSLWRSEADLQAFVETPLHVRIMNANRNRGQLTSHSLAGSDLSRRGAWRRASSVLLNTQAPM